MTDNTPAAAFAGRRCLVTGGLGFIGSNLAAALAEAGADVVVVDSLAPRHGGDWRNLHGVRAVVHAVDIADSSAMVEASNDIDVVFNLAGQVSHLDSMEDPLADLEANTRSQLVFLEMLRKLNPSVTVVFASTRQVYGRPRYLPVDEEHPLRPTDVNGITKHAAERLHLLYGEVYGFRSVVLRLTNVYGPRQRLRGDHQAFFPTFLRRAFTGQPIVLYGDGSQTRDMLYVDDAVEAFLLAATAPEAGGEIVNIGADDAVSLAHVAAEIVDIVGNGRVETAPWPREHARIDIGDFRTDASKAKRILGWSARTGLRDGIRSTVDYYQPRLAWYL